jgi:hypothetical protein
MIVDEIFKLTIGIDRILWYTDFDYESEKVGEIP